jgi:hypothetical protein
MRIFDIKINFLYNYLYKNNKKHKRENKNIIYTDMKTIITNTNLRLRSLLVTLCSESGRDVLCNLNGF